MVECQDRPCECRWSNGGGGAPGRWLSGLRWERSGCLPFRLRGGFCGEGVRGRPRPPALFPWNRRELVRGLGATGGLVEGDSRRREEEQEEAEAEAWVWAAFVTVMLAGTRRAAEMAETVEVAAATCARA